MPPEPTMTPDRRSLLKWTGALVGAAGVGAVSAQAQPAAQHADAAAGTHPHEVGGMRKGMVSFTLAHEQFPLPELIRLGVLASRSGFQVLATSDHFQPWQANEGHSG